MDWARAAHVPIVHARRSATERALCGAEPFNPWSNSRVAVTCPDCVAEIERRLLARVRAPAVAPMARRA